MTSDATPATTYDLVTAVWGAEFVELFLDVCVPNQLSPDNLPALPPGSRYRVFTTSADVPRLEASPRLDALRRVLKVDVVNVDMTEADRSAKPRERWNTHKRMIACHRRAAADAAIEGRALIFLAPDFVLAEGTIAGLVRLHSGGARAVLTANLRLSREAFLAELSARAGGAAIAPRELVGLAMCHLHPWSRSLMADGTSTSDNPTAVHWPVSSGDRLEGVLVRSFYLHPMLVDPVRRTALPGGPIDSHYVRDCCPDVRQCHVVDDSDELIVFELSPVDRAIGRQIQRHGVSPLRLAAATASCDRHQQSNWQRMIRIHAGEGDEQWTAAEAASSRFARGFEHYRPCGRVLVVMFEWLKMLRRRQDAYETVLRKARRRYPWVVRRVRRQGRVLGHNLRKVMRPPVTPKQVGRPVKMLLHRTAKAWKLRVKRFRRFYLSASSRTNL